MRSADAGEHNASRAWADRADELREPELLAAAGAARLTKLVLFPARVLFTATTGLVAGPDDAAAWYLARRGAPSAELVATARRCRLAEPAEPGPVAALLGEQLIPLYLHSSTST